MDEEFLQELTMQKMNTVWKEKKQEKITIDIDAVPSNTNSFTKERDSTNIKLSLQKRPASLSAIHIDHIFSLFNEC